MVAKKSSSTNGKLQLAFIEGVFNLRSVSKHAERVLKNNPL